ncbi:MAG: metalloregulator ArsR/SmtB family transcription factor [Boseongicola sp.]|nr:metalloregulator ArsR/SmtB family transcription factor [Boseongicola sp.]
MNRTIDTLSEVDAGDEREFPDVEEAARHLRALSNPSRLFLLCALANGEKCVGELERASGMGQAYVSQQLARLRQDGIVEATREGRKVSYALSDSRVAPILTVLQAQYTAIP